MNKFILLILGHVMFIFPMADLSELAARETVRCRGSLWNSFGDIVEDQTSEVVIRILNEPDGGEVLWEEGHLVSIEKSQIHFVLGAGKTRTSALDLNMFIENDSWIEVSVDGDVLSPRQPVEDFQAGYLMVGEKYSLSIERDAPFEDGEILVPMIIWENTVLHNTLDMGDNGIRLGGELRTTWPAGPADEFSQEEVDNLRAAELADGTTPWTDASNLSTGVIDNTLLDDDLQDLADGSLSSTRVEHGDLFIQTAGVNGQVWKSDGKGSGYWGVDNTEDDGWAITGDHVYTSLSGNVGVGITDPEEKLHVDGNILVSAGHTIKSDAGLAITIDKDGGSTSDYFSISHSAGGAELFRIDESGNMGVGTTNMSEKLDVNGGIKIGSASGASEGVISYDSVNKLMKYSDEQSWVAMKNPIVTVGKIGSGAHFECDEVLNVHDDHLQIQAALDAVENVGGGVVMLLGGSFNTSAAIDWDVNKVKLKGQGMDATEIVCSVGNAIESTTEGSKIWLEDLTIMTTGDGTDETKEGIGIYIVTDITVDLHLDRVKFITTTNAIHYELPQSSDPADPHLGNIEIVSCFFPKSCTLDDDLDDDPKIEVDPYVSFKHKVLILGHKPYHKKLNISFNEFTKDAEQDVTGVELKLSGYSGNERFPIMPLENQPFIYGGQIAFNKFDGATRECMAVRGHRNLNIIGNKMKNCDEIGLYFTRSYQSVISGNICEGSGYRGHRLDNFIETTYINNIAVNTGAGDPHAISSGGMTIAFSRNNIIMGNTIKADKNSAISIVGSSDSGFSTGNYIAFNKILGNYTDIIINDDENNVDNIIIQPEHYGVEYPQSAVLKGVKLQKSFNNGNGVSSKDLELYFPFFEDSGSFIQDYSKNGVFAEVNGVLSRSKGLFGNAVQFDGYTDNYIQLDHNIDSYNATYYFVFRANSFSGIQRLIQSSYSTGRYYILDLTDEGGEFTNVMVRYHNGVEWSTKQFNTTISTTSDIIRLAMTFEENGANIDIKMYIDGRMVDSAKLPGKPSLDSNIVFLGSEPDHPFDGDLHLFKAWSRTLTEEELWEETFNPMETVALEAYKLKGQAETVTGPGALNPALENTLLITTDADAFTLNDGAENADKFITMKTDGGDGTLTPENFTNGTSIVFDDVGDSAHLKFLDGGWVWFGGTATIN